MAIGRHTSSINIMYKGTPVEQVKQFIYLSACFNEKGDTIKEVILDGISFLVKACAEVNELFDLFHGGSLVHYIDARCVSANGHDLSLLGIQW